MSTKLALIYLEDEIKILSFSQTDSLYEEMNRWINLEQKIGKTVMPDHEGLDWIFVEEDFDVEKDKDAGLPGWGKPVQSSHNYLDWIYRLHKHFYPYLDKDEIEIVDVNFPMQLIEHIIDQNGFLKTEFKTEIKNLVQHINTLNNANLYFKIKETRTPPICTDGAVYSDPSTNILGSSNSNSKHTYSSISNRLNSTLPGDQEDVKEYKKATCKSDSLAETLTKNLIEENGVEALDYLQTKNIILDRTKEESLNKSPNNSLSDYPIKGVVAGLDISLSISKENYQNKGISCFSEEIDNRKCFFLYNKFNSHGLVLDCEKWNIRNFINDTRTFLSKYFKEIDLIEEIGFQYTSDMDVLDQIKYDFGQTFIDRATMVYKINLLKSSHSKKHYCIPDYQRVKQFLKRFSENQDKSYKIKFTELFDLICDRMSISETYINYLKNILPTILRELGITSKRRPDGVYWYGLSPHLGKANLFPERTIDPLEGAQSADTLPIEKKFSAMKALYPTRNLSNKDREKVDNLVDNPMLVLVKPKSIFRTSRSKKPFRISKKSKKCEKLIK